MKIVFSLIAASLSVAFASADGATLHLVAKNGMPIVGGYMPQRLALTKDKPAGLKKEPATTNPMYGVLDLVGTKHIVIVDGDKLYVDSNGDGDLTNDIAPKWDAIKYGKSKEFTRYGGGAMVEMPIGGKRASVSLGMYNFDEKERPQLANTLLYYSDYALEGEATVGGKKYHVAMSDMLIKGFDVSSKVDANGKKAPTGVNFLIDVNGNGKFDSRGEVYDPTAPFNIGGTTYELAKITANGFAVNKSKQTVAEILPPPDLGMGKKSIAFNTKATDGTAITFPGTFKGKLVMLDFWATWCEPCKGEIPGLAKAYEKYHPQGFEVLGISLDNEDTAKGLAKFTKEWNMPWQQVCDAKYWQAEVAQLYVVQSIPAAFLVDGDTGEIVASGNDLRGESLVPTLEKALAKKRGASVGK